MRLCKSSLITKFIILAVMVYAIMTIVTLQPKVDQLHEEKTALEAEIAQMQQENLALQEDINALGTDESAIEIARERLNMVSDGEIIYVDTSK
ncbi:MAG: septum formation initiator family protein [Ruminococcaceae bacterium]|nr:septum formation initiator family protein [Oscillospiraceae bacterium]